MNSHSHLGTLLAGCLLLLAGCSTKIERASFDADSISKQALTAYDRNADGVLDARELEASPPLRQALAKFDRDGDRKLSGTELAERIAIYNKGELPRMPLSCEVRLDDEPLAGVTVALLPEPFLGDAGKPASGVTDRHGAAALQTEDGLPDVPFGLYRVTLSKKDDAGKETIPARYNANTGLGQEVAPDLRDTMITIRLTSR